MLASKEEKLKVVRGGRSLTRNSDDGSGQGVHQKVTEGKEASAAHGRRFSCLVVCVYIVHASVQAILERMPLEKPEEMFIKRLEG